MHTISRQWLLVMHGNRQTQHNATQLCNHKCCTVGVWMHGKQDHWRTARLSAYSTVQYSSALTNAVCSDAIGNHVDAWQARSTKIIRLVTWFCLLWSLIRHSWLLVMLEPWSRRSKRLVCCQNFLLAWCTWRQQATVNQFIYSVSVWQNWLGAHSVTLTLIVSLIALLWLVALVDCLIACLVS